MILDEYFGDWMKVLNGTKNINIKFNKMEKIYFTMVRKYRLETL